MLAHIPPHHRHANIKTSEQPLILTTTQQEKKRKKKKKNQSYKQPHPPLCAITQCLLPPAQTTLAPTSGSATPTPKPA